MLVGDVCVNVMITEIRKRVEWEVGNWGTKMCIGRR